MPQPLTAVYLDFQSAACHRVWCWLSATSACERVEVRPFWSESPVAAGGRGPWERAAPTSGLELLAMGEFARELGRRAPSDSHSSRPLDSAASSCSTAKAASTKRWCATSWASTACRSWCSATGWPCA
ncbi:MAG TPA: hypothetical protein VNU01_13395, partial [Egibacteraceae bacterium]|nr:hypothetical protein [Egibacteraceae bacterium]